MKNAAFSTHISVSMPVMFRSLPFLALFLPWSSLPSVIRLQRDGDFFLRMILPLWAINLKHSRVCTSGSSTRLRMRRTSGLASLHGMPPALPLYSPERRGHTGYNSFSLHPSKRLKTPYNPLSVQSRWAYQAILFLLTSRPNSS